MNRVQPDHPHMDVLQNIEFAIVSVYKQDRDLLDFEVSKALDALERYYKALERGRTPGESGLEGGALEVYRSVKTMCDWRMGEATEAELPLLPTDEALSAGTIVRCLRRIERSVGRWTERGGQQGYLTFVEQFVG